MGEFLLEYYFEVSVAFTILFCLAVGLNIFFGLKHFAKKEKEAKERAKYEPFGIIFAKRQENGRFIVYSPVIPGLSTVGSTLPDAIYNMQSVLELSLHRHKQNNIPFDTSQIKALNS